MYDFCNLRLTSTLIDREIHGSKNIPTKAVINLLLLLRIFNDVTSSYVSHVNKRLITKGHIATHKNLIIWFKPAKYSSGLVIKLFKCSGSCFKPKLLL